MEGSSGVEKAVKKQSNSTARQHRFLMPALMALQPTTNWVIRVAINSLIPYICAEQGFSENQRAMLLAAFYPGYVGGHIPGGYMVQVLGGKITLALNMWGSAAVCALVPVAAWAAPTRQTRLRCLMGLLFALGLCQGPLIPALQTMRKDWIPNGPGRALALRLQDLGGTVTGLVAPLLPPLVATQLGWKAFFGGYAIYCATAAAIWQRYAQDKPNAAKLIPARSNEKGNVVDWGIFRTVGVQAMVAAQIGAGMSNYVMMQWQPVYFIEVLGASPLVAAVYFAWAEVASFTCDWSVALIETMLTSRQMLSRLQMRKLATLIGSFGQAGCMAAFVRCKTPLGAALSSYGVQGFYCFHHSGFGANLLEVGGTQTAMLNAVNNMIKSCAGILCPPLGVWLRRTTGSWHALFDGVGALGLITALIFAVWAKVQPPPRFRDKDE